MNDCDKQLRYGYFPTFNVATVLLRASSRYVNGNGIGFKQA